MDDFDQMSNIIGNYWGKWRNLDNFKDTTLAALRLSKQSFQQEQLAFSKSILTDPYFSKLIDQNWFKENLDCESVSLSVSDGLMASVECTVKSSIIILSHTFLDATLLELLQFTMDNQPERWDEDLKMKTITYGDLSAKSLSQIRTDLLTKKMIELEGKSILVKAETLYKRCRPPEGYQPVRNFTYKPAKFKEYDDLRHDIVHGRHSPHVRNDNYDEYEAFSKDVGNHFIAMVCEQYNSFGISSAVFKRIIEVR